MDANITTMIAIKKNKKSNSSYLFEDPILGWAGNENSKKRFKSNKSLLEFLNFLDRTKY